MITIFMVEDELATVEVCKTYISKLFSNVQWAGYAHTLQEAKEQIKTINPDILLLDISLPDGTSFDLLNELPTNQSQIIFLTAHEEFALKAIKVKAADYLLKPILVSELQLAIQNAIETIQKKKASQLSKLSLTTALGIEFVNKNDILYVKAEGNYSEIYTTQQTKIVATKVLKTIEQQLDNNFLRTHQSYVVNINFITKYNKTEQTLTLQQNIQIPVSKSRKDKVLRVLVD